MGWKREILMSCATKNKDGLLDGTCPMPPSTDKCHKQWKRCDFMVMRWISNSLDKKIRENFKYVGTSREFWCEFVERFGQSNALEVYQLTKDLGDIAQANLSLVEYYSKMKNLWETLDSIDPLPSCSCGKIGLCTCALVKKMIDRENNAKIIQFLMNLNSSYDGVRTQILSLDPLPSINKILALLQKVERQKQITETVSNLADSSAYAGFRQSDQKKVFQNSKNVASGSVNDKHCDHCNRGFPGDKAKGKEKAAYNKSHPPQKGAHSADVIPDSPLENLCLEDANHNGFNVATTGSDALARLNSAALDGIITSIVDQVLKRISDQQPTLSSINFAVDAGASDHMTYDLSLLSNVHVFQKPVRVGLPDGSIKLVQKMGTVVLTDKITLQNVFFIPDFQQNLLSVSKLLDSSHMTVLFTSTDCVFQDLSNDVIVSRGKRVGDLYTINKQQMYCNKVLLVNTIKNAVVSKFQSMFSRKSSHVNNVASQVLDLVHARLGHMSTEKLKFVPEFSHIIKRDTFQCRSCALAKHHRLPFPISTSRASACFHLMHMDSKDQVYGLIRDFFADVHTQFQGTIKAIRSDNGTEFLQEHCGTLFKSKGIVHQTSIVGTPQQNGRVERKHMHL
ncbi:uncharacterized protein LOC141589800 [Silene latifolia]|uniref:uncharacterized protein LOC141589800 n=1 Tax=Silene latifolia TaxID=37657 RepID=UPI003D785AC0